MKVNTTHNELKASPRAGFTPRIGECDDYLKVSNSILSQNTLEMKVNFTHLWSSAKAIIAGQSWLMLLILGITVFPNLEANAFDGHENGVDDNGPCTITIPITTSPETCRSSNGSASVNVLGTLLPVTYSWTGPNGFSSTAASLSNLKAGNYTLSVVDALGCTANASFLVDSIIDNVAPLVTLFNLVEFPVDTNTTIKIDPTDLIQNIVETCPYTVTYDTVALECADIGQNVSLNVYVTDIFGNQWTGATTVRPVDITPPVIDFYDKAVIQLDENGEAVLARSNISRRSYDLCVGELEKGTNVVFTISKTEFDCNDLPTTTVTVTAEDLSGNSENDSYTKQIINNEVVYVKNDVNDTYTIPVYVDDCLPPVAVCDDIEVTVSSTNGIASITPGDVDLGSYDNCTGIWYETLSDSNFTCADVGKISVNLHVYDFAGNMACCPVEVTVKYDDQKPVAVCKDTVIQLDSNGQATITAADLDGGSYDDCQIDTILIVKDTFNCNDIGDNYIKLIVVDSKGQRDSCSAKVTIIGNDGLSLDINVNDVSCIGDADGSIEIIASGGITVGCVNPAEPYSFNWSDGFVGNVRTGLNPGTYYVTIDDCSSNGCTIVKEIVIGEPDELKSTIAKTDANCDAEDITICSVSRYNSNSHAIWLPNLANGVSNKFWFENGAGSFIQYPDGTAHLTGEIYNANDANKRFDVSVWFYNKRNWTEWNALGRGIKGNSGTINGNNVDWTFYEMDPNKQNTLTGKADYQGDVLNLTHKPANLNYAFQIGVAANDKDADFGMSGWFNYTGSWSGHGDFNFDATCTTYEKCNGTAVVTATGGTAPYTIAWSNGANTDSTGYLCEGTYTVTITDANGCSIIDSVNIEGPECCNVTNGGTIDGNQANCGPFDPAPINNVTLPSGGLGGVEYVWMQSDTLVTNVVGNPYWTPVPNSNSETLDPGVVTQTTYYIRCARSIGCDFYAGESNVVTITVYPAPSISITKNNDVTCFGAADGSATVSVSSGTAPYTYSWTSGSNTADANNLTPGTYAVTVTDANGCSVTEQVVITEPTELTGTTTTTSATCVDATDGTATVNAQGGTQPYTYSWSSGGTASTETGLGEGTYTVTVTDANGCIFSAIVSIDELPAPDFSLYQMDANCDEGDLSVTQGFNVFVENDVTLSTNETEGTVALGGDLTLNGQYTIAGHSAGNYIDTSANDNKPSALVVGGRVYYNNGGINVVNNGFVKICDLTGSNVYDWDVQNNQPMNTRISSGGLNSNPRINLSTYQSASSVNSCPLDFAGAFDVLRYTSMAFSNCTTNVSLLPSDPNNPTASPFRKKITLANGQNVLNLNWSELSALSEIIFNNQPSATKTLVINVDAPGTITWNAPQFAGIGDQHGEFIIWNFVNTTTLNMVGSRAIYGTVLAPNADVDDNNQNNINGQLIAKSLVHRGGEMHDYFFAGDDKGCTGSCLTEINNNDEITICDGDEVTLTASGGNGVSYLWNTNSTDSSITVSTSGTYSVTVTNANNCPSTKSIIVNISNISISLNANDPSCATGADGSISSTITGGTAPYTYLWSNNETTSDIDDLTEGTYSLTVTDANGCTATEQVTITKPACCNVTSGGTIDGDQANCGPFDPAPINSVTLPSGGLGGVEYVWMQSNVNVPNIVGNPYWTPVPNSNSETLDPGYITQTTYYIRCSRSIGCSFYAGESNVVTITVNPAPSISITKNNDVTCYGAADGSATVSVSTGTAPYTYSWTSGSTTADANNLTPGTYTVTVTDANGCTATEQVTITQPSELTATVTSNNLTCNGGNNGSATCLASGGTSPYSYSWSSGDNTANAEDLAAGTYTVVVTDANGCTVTKTVTITEPSDLDVTVSSTDITCGGSVIKTCTVTRYNNNSHAIWLPNLANGVSDKFWFTNNAGTFTQYPDGTAHLTGEIYNANDANKRFEVSVWFYNKRDWAQWSALGRTIKGNTNIINGSNVDWTLYEMDPNKANTLTGLADYQGDVLNLTHKPANLKMAFQIGVAANDKDGDFGMSGWFNYTGSWSGHGDFNFDASCSDDDQCDGTATASATGGTAPYTFSWSNGESTTSINDLCEGTYTVTVTDANGCVKTETVTISAPAELTATINANDPTCASGTNGSASVSASGGTSPYSYKWSTGATTASISGLSAGIYSVTVTDAQGCQTIVSTTLSLPACCNVTNGGTIDGDQANCGPFDPSPINNVTLPSGGLGGVEYVWMQSNVNVPNIVGNPYWTPVPNSNSETLDPGYITQTTYYIRCSRSIGCSFYAGESNVVTITVNPAPSISITKNNDVTCYGAADGSATVSVSTGTAPYSYSWTSGSTTADANNLTPGTYTVTVTDANGCTATEQVTITQPSELTATTSSTDASCLGTNDGTASVSVSGGTAPYTYAWSNAATTASISAQSGTYSVTVTDANGCTITKSITVDFDDNVNPVASCKNITVQLNSNGSASITAADVDNGSSDNCGIGSMTVSPSSFDCSDVGNNTVTLTVTDVNGNTATCQATVTVEDNEAPTAVCQNISVQLNQNGVASIVAADVDGGSYDNCGIDNMTVTPASFDCNSVGPNTVTLTITDVNGNTSTCAAVVTVEDNIAPTANCKNITVVLDANGEASISASDINDSSTDNCGIDNISISQTDFDCSHVGNNSITLTVEDVNGNISTCTSTVTVEDNEDPTITGVPSTITVTANANDCTPSVNWTPPTGDDNCSVTLTSNYNPGDDFPIGTTTVTYTATDGSGNTATASFNVVVNASPIVVNVTTNDVSCNGSANGTASVTVSGGCKPYSYLWSNNSTSTSVTGLTAGTYSITITDANNNTKTVSFTIDEPNQLVATVSGSDPTCATGTDGSASVSVTGGTAPYTYLWSNNSTASNINNLSSGTYSVTVTDANGCTTTGSVTIARPACCNVVSGGSIGNGQENCGPFDPVAITNATSPSGGLGGVEYMWLKSNVNTPNTVGNPYWAPISGANGATYDPGYITQTTYYIRCSRSVGCTDWVGETNIIAMIVNPVPTVSISATDTICTGGNDGAIDLTVNSGTAPFTYTWTKDGSAFATTEDLTSLGAGTYAITVTDDNGCSAIGSITIIERNGFSITGITSDILCYGDDDGSIDISINGGTTTTSITNIWVEDFEDNNLYATSDNGSTAWSRWYNSSNNYAKVKSNNGGKVFQMNNGDAKWYSESIDISNYSNVDVDIELGSEQTNKLDASGSYVDWIKVYYRVDNGNWTYFTTNYYTTGQLSSSNIHSTVSGLNGNSLELKVWAHSTANDEFYFVDNVTVSAETTSNGNYTFLWSNNATTEDLTGITAGTYSVVVTDENGCVVSESFDIDEPTELNLSADVVKVSCQSNPDPASCSNGIVEMDIEFTGNDGSDFIVKDGNGNTLGSFTNVDHGDVVTVTSNGAIVGPIEFCVPSCAGKQYGQNTASGCRPSVNAEFNCNNQSVTVCSSKDLSNVVLKFADNTEYKFDNLNVGKCETFSGIGSNSGKEIVGVWIKSGCNSSGDGPGYGEYVANANGTACHQLSLDCNNAIVGASIDDFEIVAFKDANGNSSQVSNSNNCEMALDNLQHGELISNQFASDGISISADANGNKADELIIFNTDESNTADPDLEVNIGNILIFPENNTDNNNDGIYDNPDDQVVGGTITFTYNSPRSVVSLKFVDSENNNGWVKCYDVNDNILSNKTIINAGDASVQTVSINTSGVSKMKVYFTTSGGIGDIIYDCSSLGCDGAIDLTVSGGTAPYTYVWDNGKVTEDLGDLCEGTYTVVVTDANGCSKPLEVTVGKTECCNVTAGGTIAQSQTNCGAFDPNAITSSIAASGGEGTLQYKWMYSTSSNTYSANDNSWSEVSGANTESYDPSMVSNTTHFVRLAKRDGCSDWVGVSNVVTMTVNNGPTASINLMQAATCQNPTASIQGSISGANSGYQWYYNGNPIFPGALDINTATPGDYTLEVFGTTCTTSVNYTVAAPSSPSVTASITGSQPISSNCDCEGRMRNFTVIYQGSSNVTVRLYNKKKNKVIETINNVQYGDVISFDGYDKKNRHEAFVHLRVDNGSYTEIHTSCSINILGNTYGDFYVQSYVDGDGNFCNGSSSCDGEIDVTVSGGSAPYAYSWATGESTQDLSDLCPGTYTVTVTDANGCSTQKTFTVGTRTVSSRSASANKESAVNGGVSNMNDAIVDAFEISVSPNPTQGFARINYIVNESATANVVVTDMAGKQLINVYDGFVEGGVSQQLDVNMAQLRSGIYMIVIKTSAGESMIERVIVSH